VIAEMNWAVAASLLTAGGTLALAMATFVSVRSSNRSARLAEYALQVGIRPLLMHSRLGDPEQKIMWGDAHWARLGGGAAIAEIADGNVYLAMSLRNSASGVAVIHGWHLGLQDLEARLAHPHAEPDEFRPQMRDLYVPGGDVGFWQAAIRDREDPEYADLVEAVETRRVFVIELLYTDHEGGQRTIGQYAIAPGHESGWFCSMVRHWNLDRPDPR
jgi:hypothetical protein